MMIKKGLLMRRWCCRKGTVMLCLSIFTFGLPAFAKNGYSYDAERVASVEQMKKIHGVVKDVNGEPVIGANVVIKGSGKGSITDANGRYALDVPEGAIIRVSFIGYNPVDVKIGNNTEINVVLDSNAENLDEVVVVGYGSQKKANLTGAVDQVSEKVFANRSLSNVTQSLQGAVPNLNITLGDGKPTRTASYNLRGLSSIGQGGSALVLIDGAEGDPSMLNPNDIESVSVLKDAASAAIYGSRGTFGVVLITTKNAKQGKTSVNYTVNTTFGQPINVPDIVADGYTYASMFYEAYYNARNATPAKLNKTQIFSTAWLSDFKARKDAGNTKNYEVINGTYVYYGNENYYKDLYKTSTFAQDHNISINGSSGKFDYYLSGRYYGYDGLFRYNSDKYKTYNLRAKESLQVNDWLKVTNNTDFSKLLYHNPINVGEGGSIWRNIADEGHPSSPLFNPDGSLTYSAAYTVGDFFYGKNGINTDNRILKNTTSATASFLKDQLHVNGDFTFRITDNKATQIRVPVPYSTSPGVTSYLSTSYNDIQVTNQRYDYLAGNIYIDFSAKIAQKHAIKAMVGYNYEEQTFNGSSTQRNGLLTENVTNINLALGQTYTTSGSYTQWRTIGLFSRVNYSYADRYLFEFNSRYDGSSKFPTSQQWGFFPSASAGWRVSEEPFWHVNPKLISDLKIRGSFGSLGNGNINPYSYEELLNISASGRMLNGVNNQITSAPAVIPNGLTWETATTANVGLDMGMLSNRLHFTGDAYVRKTKNMYTTGPTLPDVFGADSPKGNYADLTTRGWEITLTYADNFRLAGKPFNYQIKGTLSDYLSKIDKYNNATGSLTDYYAGETVGEIWGYHVEGLFTDQADINNHATQKLLYASSDGLMHPGDVKFGDLDHSGVIDYGTNTLSNHGDLKVIGNTTPRYTYSFTLSADWNNLFISAFIQGIGHQDWYPSSECIFWGQYNRPYNNIPTWQLGNIWSADNPNAYLPRYVGYNNMIARGGFSNDRYLQNVAYCRLKNLQLGYNLPKQLIAPLKIQSFRIYVSGENLLCFSPLYKWTRDIDVANIYGSDKDLTSGTSGDGMNYPTLRTYSFGASLTF
jgi:TonB-linked SusC/RagA family outer membrane protein